MDSPQGRSGPRRPLPRVWFVAVIGAAWAWVAVWATEYFRLALLSMVWVLEVPLELAVIAVALAVSIVVAVHAWRSRRVWLTVMVAIGVVIAIGIAVFAARPSTFAVTWWHLHRSDFAEIARRADTGGLTRTGSDYTYDLPTGLSDVSLLTGTVRIGSSGTLFVPAFEGVPDDEFGFERGGRTHRADDLYLGDGWWWVDH